MSYSIVNSHINALLWPNVAIEEVSTLQASYMRLHNLLQLKT